MKLLAIDPGHTTGWATLTVLEDGEHSDLRFGETKDTNLLELQDQIRESDLVIYESFLVRPQKARRGSFDWNPMVTSQVIGALKLLCHQLEKPIVEQNPSVKPAGYGFANLPYKAGKKGTHAYDAIAHAFHYGVVNLHLKPVGT